MCIAVFATDQRDTMEFHDSPAQAETFKLELESYYGDDVEFIEIPGVTADQASAVNDAIGE